MATTPRPATIKDVAKLVGVSYQTVSRVINDKPDVDPETKRRVLEAVGVLRYRPSRHARALVRPDVKTIGLIVPDVRNPFFPELIDGVIDSAAERGWQVTITTTGKRPGREAEVLHATLRQADAVIGYFDHTEDAIRDLDTDMPLVTVDHELSGPFGGVRIGVDRAVREGVAHLLARGHDELGMLDGSSGCDRHRRRQVFTDMLTGLGRPPAARRIRVADPSIEAATAAAHDLLDDNPELNGIFAFNDLMAIGALHALRARGLDVPRNCGVLGFDGLALGQLVTPTLTSLHIDKHRLGALAVDQVERLFADPAARPEPGSTLLEPELVVGGST
ncbi:MAG: LacI family DNA-binding transcriptional regulator [Kutzneria sp.]|nr:LacI family DNA-binding transcriptional regulator [Kutzneria sp.]